MTPSRNPGRVAGLWYLLLVFLGPLRLIYIPNKLFDLENPARTASNIANHDRLFRSGMVSELAAAVVLIFLVLALYRLFYRVSRQLAVQVIFFGGVMPAVINLVGVALDEGVLMVAHGAPFLSSFAQPQRDALVVLLLRMHGFQTTAVEILWGVWLFPLGLLVYRSRVVPRFIGVWLLLNGLAYVLLSLAGLLSPPHYGRFFLVAQPALLGELVLALWLVIKGARIPSGRTHGIASASWR